MISGWPSSTGDVSWTRFRCSVVEAHEMCADFLQTFYQVNGADRHEEFGTTSYATFAVVREPDHER